MMSRTQVTLDSEVQKRARQRATAMGISFAAYIRRLVNQDLEQPVQRVDPSLVFDLGCSGGADVANQKDSMVGAAIAADRLRRDTNE